MPVVGSALAVSTAVVADGGVVDPCEVVVTVVVVCWVLCVPLPL
jgi:hypothetical protein